MPLPDSEHESEELGRLARPRAQLSRPAEDRADLGCRIAADREVGDAKRTEQLELAGVSLAEDSGSVSINSRPLVRWPIASTSADRSRERRPAWSQYSIAFSEYSASVKWWAINSGCAASGCSRRASIASAIRRWNCWRFPLTSALYKASSSRACLKM